MKQAISNQRKMDAIIDEMRALTQKVIFALPRNEVDPIFRPLAG
jgi:hypothetical protein